MPARTGVLAYSWRGQVESLGLGNEGHDQRAERKTFFLGIVCVREGPFNEPVTVVANLGRSLGQFHVLP